MTTRQVTTRQVAGAAFGLGGVGSVASAVLGSPLPVLVLGGLMLVVLVLLAVPTMVAVLCKDEARRNNAVDVLGMLLAVIPSYRQPKRSPT